MCCRYFPLLTNNKDTFIQDIPLRVIISFTNPYSWCYSYSFSSVPCTTAPRLPLSGELCLTEHIEYDERNHYDWCA